MIVKVKEPLADEYPKIRAGQIVYTYLHLAADKPLTEALLASGAKGVAYETVTDRFGKLPLLKPMSEVAGRLSVQEGAKYLESPLGGRGTLLGGVTGVAPANVVIIGGGTVGTNSAKMAVGLGARVTVIDRDLDRLEYLDDIFGGRVTTLYSTNIAIHRALETADLTVGSVLLPGAAAPKLIKRSYLKDMKKKSVLVDVAVDQGGCAETTHPTYHDDPTYVVDDVVHYTVANMPGAVALTSTLALTNATLPYGLKIAGQGLETAAKKDPGILNGINVYEGKLTFEPVAIAHGLEYTDIHTLIN
jgi:alanine dehydrogenase